MDIIKLDGIPKTTKWKYTPFAHCISGFQGTYKNLQDAAISSFISYYFTSVFTSADTISHNSLELHSSLTEKRFCHKFSFFNRFAQTPHALNGQNLPAWHELLADAPLTGLKVSS